MSPIHVDSDALKKNAHDQNEQTIKSYVCHKLTGITDALKNNPHHQNDTL